MSARVAFGRRGGNSSSTPAIEARDAAKAIVRPSAAYADVAGSARSAFQGRDGVAAPFEPATVAVSSRPLGDEEAMRAFVGPNWRAYQRLWDRCRGNPSLSHGFGWGPALFGATWLAYRKRYIWGIGLFAAEVALGLWAPSVGAVAAVIFRMFVGRYGKSLVLVAGAAELARLRRVAGASAAQLPELRRAGGVTIWLPALLVLAGVWMAIERARHPEANVTDAAGLLGQVQDALP